MRSPSIISAAGTARDIGVLPLLNAILYRSSPVAVAVDRVFRSQVWQVIGSDDSQQDNLWESPIWHEDGDGTAFGTVRAESEDAGTMRGQAGTGEATPQAAAVGYVFAEADS
jgi:hypothetical protein